MNRRILHLVPFLWSGAGSVVTRLCLTQQPRHDVAIVTSGRSKGLTDWPSYRRQLAAAGVERFSVDLFDRDPAVFWSSVDALHGIVRQWRPDVVHAHAGVPACAAAIARQVAGRPFALVAQLYSWGVNRPAWMNTMDLQGFAAADRVVCSAAAYRDTLLEAGIPSARIDYVPWGLPLDELRGSRSRIAPASRPGAPLIGFVGRVEPRKGQLQLVEAFARFRVRNADARLELIGPVADAAYGKELHRAVRAFRLSGSVSVPGLVRRVAPKVSRWNLFVSLSSDEGQGMAVLEAMALGVPVLARRVSGVEDYLEDGSTGTVLEKADPAYVAHALDAAWAGRARLAAIARRAARMVERRYGWESTMRGIEGVYDSAAA